MNEWNISIIQKSYRITSYNRLQNVFQFTLLYYVSVIVKNAWNLTNILTAVVGVTHWNVRAQPELGLECAAEGGKGQPMYGRSPY